MSTSHDDLERRLSDLKVPDKVLPQEDDLQARLAALSPKRAPERPAAVGPSDAEVDAYLNGEEWLGESVESSNADLDLPSPPSSIPTRPRVSHRMSDAFSPIDVQVVIPSKSADRTAEEERALIERLQDDLAVESEQAREAEKRVERLARLSTGEDVDEAWLGPPPGELQLPDDAMPVPKGEKKNV